MNARTEPLLVDVQSLIDPRGIAIDAAGVKSLRYPVSIVSRPEPTHTVASFAMSVALASAARGTHMSRFVELLEAQKRPLDLAGFQRMFQDMLRRLDAEAGDLAMYFPYFVRKAAPVSRVESLLDCEVQWRADRSHDGAERIAMRVAVPATSLCPCSKAISAYGAHNQRSRITIDALLTAPIDIEDLIAAAEKSASCGVYGLLKRADEKSVTETAYENAKFAEDVVRDVVLALEGDTRIRGYTVEVENFESIHNHSAFARVSRAPHSEVAP